MCILLFTRFLSPLTGVHCRTRGTVQPYIISLCPPSQSMETKLLFILLFRCHCSSESLESFYKRAYLSLGARGYLHGSLGKKNKKNKPAAQSSGRREMQPHVLCRAADGDRESLSSVRRNKSALCPVTLDLEFP